MRRTCCDFDGLDKALPCFRMATAWPRPGELHLWPWTRAALRALPLAREDWLSQRELARLARLPALLREDALRLRCAVRRVLAAYLDAPPESLQFTYGDNGKPELVTQSALWFSLSHAKGRALLAVSATSPIGVDVERIPHPPRDLLAERMLGPQAWRSYRALNEVERGRAFALAWAEREAFVKALGVGVADGWGLCRSLFGPLPLRTDSAGSRRVAGWQLRAIQVGPGWVAAVCTAGVPAQLRWLLPCQDPAGVEWRLD